MDLHLKKNKMEDWMKPTAGWLISVVDKVIKDMKQLDAELAKVEKGASNEEAAKALEMARDRLESDKGLAEECTRRSKALREEAEKRDPKFKLTFAFLDKFAINPIEAKADKIKARLQRKDLKPEEMGVIVKEFESLGKLAASWMTKDGAGTKQLIKYAESLTAKEKKIEKFIKKKALTVDEFVTMYHAYEASPEQLRKHVLKQSISYKGMEYKITEYNGTNVWFENMKQAASINSESITRMLEYLHKKKADTHFAELRIKGARPEEVAEIIRQGGDEEVIKKKLVGVKIRFGFQPLIDDYKAGKVHMQNCPSGFYIRPDARHIKAIASVKNFEEMNNKIGKVEMYHAKNMIDLARFTEEQVRSASHWGFTKEEAKELMDYWLALRGKI